MNKTDKLKSTPQQDRRRVLKTAVLGGAAAAVTPEKWTRPIVDSVMLPAHATTTDAVTASKTFLTPLDGAAGELVVNESFPDIVLPPEEEAAELEAAQSAMKLSDLFISPAHAEELPKLSLNFTTRYYIGTTDGVNFNFTSRRVFDKTGNVYFAQGMLTVGNTTGCDTYQNCSSWFYTKQVTLVAVSENQATIKVTIGPLSYTRVIPRIDGVLPGSC